MQIVGNQVKMEIIVSSNWQWL